MLSPGGEETFGPVSVFVFHSETMRQEWARQYLLREPTRKTGSTHCFKARRRPRRTEVGVGDHRVPSIYAAPAERTWAAVRGTSRRRNVAAAGRDAAEAAVASADGADGDDAAPCGPPVVVVVAAGDAGVAAVVGEGAVVVPWDTGSSVDRPGPTLVEPSVAAVDPA